MNFKRLLLPAGILLAAGCGGGDDKKILHVPFVEFRVNGVLAPTELDLFWAEALPDTSLGFCNPDVFDNGQQAIDSAPDYCNRSFTNLTFSVRYTNATFETIDVNYKGIGFEAHLYRYDESKEGFKGEEVWNSSYYTQSLTLAAQEFEAVDNFDPNKGATVSVRPGDSLPSVAGFFTATFEGNKLFRGTGEYDPVTAEANLIKEPKETYGVDCDWALIVNSVGDGYRRVRCLGEELLPEPGTGTVPVKFVASVQFNFNGWTEQPEDIIITINPPQ